MDRRGAIAEALKIAQKETASPDEHKNWVILITGKGTDPYIMIEGGKKIPWSDEEVAREEIRKIMSKM